MGYTGVMKDQVRDPSSTQTPAENGIPELNVQLTAHQEGDEVLLLVSITATGQAQPVSTEPMNIALVLDRSGSMSGPKLQVAKGACARFVESLRPEDRVSAVVYDDLVNVLFRPAQPSAGMSSMLGTVECGGSTNLYGGWVTGAKLVGKGGRVVLLSDGLANVGRFTDAASLATHAELSYLEYGVTTSTIGVGLDYDEHLMSEMARKGGGSHYFANEVADVMNALSQERYSAGAVLIEHVSLKVGATVHQLGSFWDQETKHIVVVTNDLHGLTASVRFVDRATKRTTTNPLDVPKVAGHSEEVKLRWLTSQLADVEAGMISVRDSSSARAMRLRLRDVVFKLLEHPASGDPSVVAIINRARSSMEKLRELEEDYREPEALMHRKRSMQVAYNLREPSKGFSSFDEDHELMDQLRETSAPRPMETITFDRQALTLAPIEGWRNWAVLPVEVTDSHVVVAMVNPRDGFLISEVEKAVGRKVIPRPKRVTRKAILAELSQHDSPPNP